MRSYPVLDPVSQAYPEVQGRSPTCYSPVRHSSTPASRSLSVRLACVKHAASVHPEPGSNSPQKSFNKTSETGREKPKTQPKNKPNQHHHHNSSSIRPGKKSKNYKGSTTNPHPTGKKRGSAKKREKINQPAHTKPNSSMIHQWIQPHHHRHTPKQTQRMQNTAHTRQANNPRNKSTLAHYRVLKQHQHTQTNPHNASQPQVTLESVNDRFPARHTNQENLTHRRGVVGLADSI